MTDISFIDFINEGALSQDNYAKASGFKSPFDHMSKDERYQMILNNLFHASEEIIEARRELVRRPWKKDEVGCLDSAEKRLAFVEEIFDVFLFLRATLAYAEVTGEDFCKVATRKLEYNSKRDDHHHL